MRLFTVCAMALPLALGLAAPARAWSGHTLCTWQALQVMPEVAQRQVAAQTLDAFVAAQAPALERLLAEQEAWARAHVSDYAPWPDELAFRAPAASAAAGAAANPSGAGLAERFLFALRLNPFSRLPLALQLRPGAEPGERAVLPFTAITTLASGVAARGNRYVRLNDGETVSALEVVATAANEPDYGLDIGLYADSGTPHGARFGFGRQPFGNATVDYSSQAPFHMGFHHESRIVFAAARFLKRTMPEARVALFMALARHAFASGHEYWGWRFTGWALHYVQDLTQPYHSSVLPGVSTARMLAINTVAMLGWQGPKNDAITLVSNRHMVVENYQYRRMVRAYTEGRLDDALLAALRDTSSDRAHWRHEGNSTRAVVSREAHASADALDAQLVRSFPPSYTADASVHLGMEADLLDLPAISLAHSTDEHARLQESLVGLMQRLGRHSRAVVRAVLGTPVGPSGRAGPAGPAAAPSPAPAKGS